MEKCNEIQRSEIWNQIYTIVNKIPREKTIGDAMDASSASTELEEFFLKLLAHNNEQYKELIFNAYKEGFDSATASLIGANKVVQERKMK